MALINVHSVNSTCDFNTSVLKTEADFLQTETWTHTGPELDLIPDYRPTWMQSTGSCIHRLHTTVLTFTPLDFSVFDHPPTPDPTLVPLPTRSWRSGGCTRAPPRGPRSPRLCLSHYRCPFRSYCLCPEASAMPCDPLEENRLCVSATGLRMGFLSLPPGLLGIYGTNTTESLPTSACWLSSLFSSHVCVCVCERESISGSSSVS